MVIFPSMKPTLADTRGLRLGLGGAPLGNLLNAICEEEARAVLLAALNDGCQSASTGSVRYAGRGKPTKPAKLLNKPPAGR